MYYWAGLPRPLVQDINANLASAAVEDNSHGQNNQSKNMPRPIGTELITNQFKMVEQRNKAGLQKKQISLGGPMGQHNLRRKLW